MARHVYAEPNELTSTSSPGAGLFWVAAIGGGAAVVAGVVMQWASRGLLFLLFFIALVATRLRVVFHPRLAREIQSIQLDRLRERIPEAIARARALLRRKIPRIHRAQVLAALGECAEMEGDFAEAADLFVRAEGLLRATRMNGVLRAQQLALVAARRAFAHAACGELDRAETTLRTAGVRDGVPLAGPLSSRALLLVLARRGLKQQVIERLATDGKLLRNALAYRDRALVAVLAAYANGKALPRGAVDEGIASWIGRAFPEASAVIGAAS